MVDFRGGAITSAARWGFQPIFSGVFVVGTDHLSRYVFVVVAP